jgi:hypothetical protein
MQDLDELPEPTRSLAIAARVTRSLSKDRQAPPEVQTLAQQAATPLEELLLKIIDMVQSKTKDSNPEVN